MSVHPSSTVSDQTICQAFIKTGIGILYKKLLRKQEFCENWCSERHTLLMGINESLSYILLILPDWLNFRKRDVHRNLSHCEFRENRCQ